MYETSLKYIKVKVTHNMLFEAQRGSRVIGLPILDFDAR